MGRNVFLMGDRIIVLGFPRSGTGSMAKELGLGHEVWNDKGISDWHMVFSYKKKEGDRLVHVVRNPIDVISSNLFTMKQGSLAFIKESADIGDVSLLSIIVKGLIAWTRKIELIGLQEMAGNYKTVAIEDRETKSNCRFHPTLKWEDLKYLPTEDLNKLKELAIRHGYDPND